jgi:hypothetical protein
MNRFQPIITSLIALLLLCTSSSCTPKHPESWYPAKKEHRPYLRWWWLGSAVDEEGLTFNLEQFADKGGWTIDLQFIDAMGFGYLLAHGVGKPVADAKTRIAAEFKGNKKDAPAPEPEPEASAS